MQPPHALHVLAVVGTAGKATVFKLAAPGEVINARGSQTAAVDLVAAVPCPFVGMVVMRIALLTQPRQLVLSQSANGTIGMVAEVPR